MAASEDQPLKPSDYTILIVDDEDDLRDSMVFDFKRKGFRVLSASSGRKALETLQANEVDLVLSDIRMPDGDGVELLDSIRRLDPLFPVVILITGFADITEQECVAKGAKQVVAKPFDRKALMAAVIESLQGVRA